MPTTYKVVTTAHLRCDTPKCGVKAEFKAENWRDAWLMAWSAKWFADGLIGTLCPKCAVARYGEESMLRMRTAV